MRRRARSRNDPPPNSNPGACLGLRGRRARAVIESARPVQPAPALAAAPAPPRPAQPSPFREFLAEINPLQYVPVLGTIYRSVTGDTIPEAARVVGSFVVSGLLGGPVGLATSVATLVAERVAGIDPERIGHELLADIGIGKHEAAPTTAAAASLPTPKPQAPEAVSATVAMPAWSPAQLSAYGVTIDAAGTARRGNLQGADALNDAELSRLGTMRVA